MKIESGNKSFAIWLLGDSDPERWSNLLEEPLDSRHPTRHNIWTSVVDVIQDEVYRKSGTRLDSSQLYIRNAIKDVSMKPKEYQREWCEKANYKLKEFREISGIYKPKIIISFGAFSYEFARRAFGEKPEISYKYWTVKQLGEEFRRRIFQFSFDTTNILPLLHRIIVDKFIFCNSSFCGWEGANYFEYVGKEIAKILNDNSKKLNIWIDLIGDKNNPVIL